VSAASGGDLLQLGRSRNCEQRDRARAHAKGSTLRPEGVDHVSGHLAEHSDEQLPAVVIVCDEPPATQIGMLDALGQQAAKLGAAVLTSGTAITSATMTVRVDQTIQLKSELPVPGPLQPFSLDASALKEAIEVILEA
jgi:hypothetical protein